MEVLVRRCVRGRRGIAGHELRAARPGKPAWDDPRLAVTLSAKGQLDGKTLKRLDTTTIEIASGTDDFTATLVSPVAEPSAAAAWPFDAHFAAS